MCKMTQNLRTCPVRDKISVEKRIYPTCSYHPVRDRISLKNIAYLTARRFAHISVFYRHNIPNGMTKFT